MKFNKSFIKHTSISKENNDSSVVSVKVISNSMEPLIKTNKCYFFSTLNFTPHIGDVVLYARRGQLYCHRIISHVDGFYITKGDNCIFPDNSSVARKEILGIIVFPSILSRMLNQVQILVMTAYNGLPLFIHYYSHVRFRRLASRLFRGKHNIRF